MVREKKYSCKKHKTMKKLLFLLLFTAITSANSFSQQPSDTIKTVEFVGRTAIVTKTFVVNNEKISSKTTLQIDPQVPTGYAELFITKGIQKINGFSYLDALSISPKGRSVFLKQENGRIVPFIKYSPNSTEGFILVILVLSTFIGLMLSRLDMGKKTEWNKAYRFTGVLISGMIVLFLLENWAMSPFEEMIEPKIIEWVSLMTNFLLYGWLIYIVFISIETFYKKFFPQKISAAV